MTLLWVTAKTVLPRLLKREKCFHLPSILRSMSSATEGGGTTYLQGREVEIPVPWGMIAGREWGDPDGHPWIGLHGWLDNCGSLDKIASLFPKKGHRLICIDLPGHGLSSHYPEGLHYHYLDSLQYIRRIADHYKWSKFSLIGHSMGGSMSAIYAATYPDQLEMVIGLDALLPYHRSQEEVLERTRDSVDTLLNFEQKKATRKPPRFTFEDAKHKLIQGYTLFHGPNAITSESADALLRRGIIRKEGEEEDLFVFTRDLKYQVMGLYGYSIDVWSEFAKAIVCPHLIVTAKSKPGYFVEAAGALDKVTAFYQSSNPKFYLRPTEGNHFLHLNNPERVLVHVEEMLEKHPVKSV